MNGQLISYAASLKTLTYNNPWEKIFPKFLYFFTI